MNTRQFKSKLYKELATVTKSLSNPHRLEILDLLAQGSFPVEYIAAHTHMPIANASQHLQVLKNSGLATTERDGKYIYYRIQNRQVLETWLSLRMLGFSQNEEINQLLKDYRLRKNQLYIIKTDELLEKMNKKDVILLDVRPKEEYEAGHIENAASKPFKNLKETLNDLPVETDIVAYCRGPLCLMADEAVTLLRSKGYNAYRLEKGYSDWLAENHPVSEI